MLAWELWAAFFGYAIPMVISPGPGNTLLATAGGRFGIRGSVPFWLGFEAANLVLCLIYGLGLGRVLHDYPAIELALKWVGVLYLLYLAKGFLMPSAKGAAEARDTSRLGFGAGFFCVMVNPKIHSMIVVMFAQFLKPGASMATQAALLTTGFMLVGVTCHFPWIAGGKVVLQRFRSPRALRIQGWIFGLCMLAVAAYVALT
ncbi:LysE family translocator [Ralstonia insidiosa]|uniref:LysE family translocator n=1 Tax=Ralstonia TaxID=48736 RepID=UPI000664BEDC|nr:LysE family translocator [Ralstonia insidiosa]KMW48528.1 lysine transporter LysE [Ralstonia sp. MD27]MBX3770822.1 LysE family translocator [Ralstonia pickettii]NOZ17557.1 LysE family translocator [Betaproteobacteria bacterium]MBA9854981.1 LysE family translocator [Ralstonia insidiosa]MBA9870958.1 LysE family translocator [Ralstonia insidiosa]